MFSRPNLIPNCSRPNSQGRGSDTVLGARGLGARD